MGICKRQEGEERGVKAMEGARKKSENSINTGKGKKR